MYGILTTPIEEISDPILKSRLQNLLSKSEASTTAKTLFEYLKQVTVVVKTRKPCGFHAYWLSHSQHKHVATKNCKRGHEFEIKTDKSLGHGNITTFNTPT